MLFAIVDACVHVTYYGHKSNNGTTLTSLKPSSPSYLSVSASQLPSLSSPWGEISHFALIASTKPFNASLHSYLPSHVLSRSLSVTTDFDNVTIGWDDFYVLT